MFSSLANLLFGSNSNTSTNPESNNRVNRNQENSSTRSRESSAIGRRDNNYQTVSTRSIDGPVRRYNESVNKNDDLDDDWLLVNREDDEEDSLPRTDSEEELPFVEIKRSPTFQQRPRNTNHHSLSAYHQRSLALRYDDGGVTQSLYAVPTTAEVIGSTNFCNIPATVSMEESWFLTPPPCFTSTGPINMETSPFENLLIEHPSMSVYHSIRSAQEAGESFVDLDLGANESQNETTDIAEQPPVVNQPVHHRTGHNRADRLASAQTKMEYLARQTQKAHDKKERQNICRGAIKRANKVREFNSRGNRQRRSDMQHCKVISGANNNRRC